MTTDVVSNSASIALIVGETMVDDKVMKRGRTARLYM
jgi:hypothetical protein